TLRTVVPHVTLRTLRADGTAAIEHVAGTVVVDVLGLEVALIILVQVPAAHAVMTLRSLRPGVTIWPPGTGITVRALRTEVSLGALLTLRTLLAAVSLGPLRTHRAVIAAVALRARCAVSTLAIEHGAAAVLIHVFPVELAVTVTVQIPAMETVSAVRALVALGALGTLIALGTGVTGVPVVSLGALWTHRAV